MKTIAMTAFGTRGDVQPAIALGKALHAQGYRVRLIASANFGAWIKSHGLEVAPSQIDIQALMLSEGGHDWVEKGNNPIAQIRLMRRLLDQSGDQMTWDTWLGCQGADVVISSFTSDAYVATIAEKLRIPHISMPLQPTLVPSQDGRVVLNAPLPNRRSPINYWFSKLVLEPYPWRMLHKQIQVLRQKLAMPAQTARENRRALQRMLTVHAFSPSVVPHPADWPANVHTTGYWFLDEHEHWQPPTDLLAFLAAGTPPVYLGFGSMTGRDPLGMTRLLLEAVQQSGQRAVLLSGWAGMGQIDLPETVYCLDNAPHSWLFPHMAAVVHHGGAGTTAAGLRVGVPTIIVPHMADQPYWGQRVHVLGVGPAPIPRPRLTAARLAEAIRIAVSDTDMKQRAAALGAQIRAENGVETAVQIMTQFMQTQQPD